VDQIVVNMADCGIADVPGQVLVTFGLGSCIGLAAYDPEAAVGALLHFMLPDSSIDLVKARANPWMFADTGIARLFDVLCRRGAAKHRLVLRAVGAARILDRENGFHIGKDNDTAMRRILHRAGLALDGEAIGGNEARTMRLEIGTGRVWFQEGRKHRELAGAPRRNGGHSCRNAI